MSEWWQGFFAGGLFLPVTVYLGQIVLSDWIFQWRLDKMIRQTKRAQEAAERAKEP